jgi:hypothetical protein
MRGKIFLCSILLIAGNSAWQLSFASPNAIDYSMYFLSQVKDSEECSMTVKNGRIVTPDSLRNISMTCPDMFSWQLFTEVIRGEFWSKWADETQNWPGQPYPLCKDPDKPSANCCTPKHPEKNPAGHCPVFPGDQTGKSDAAPLMRIGRPSIMETHGDQLRIDPKLFESTLLKKVKQLKLKQGQIPDCAAVGITPKDIITPELIKNSESIGRIVRQTNAEVTVRNRSFHYFLFRNNLYNADGVANIFLTHDRNLQNNAPYQAVNDYALADSTFNLSKVDLPADAIMIKSNWLHEGLAQQLGIKESANAGFIRKYLATQISYGADKTCNLEGTHYLMAFHVSSKDIPQWVWATFEHVSMPGRCDITGCNDAYGYKSSDTLPAGVADNYVTPKVQSDKLNSPSAVFNRDQLYPVEKIRPGLDSVLKALQIGARQTTNPKEPAPQDLAWRSYRLKGSQVEFVDKTGRATFLGNSITEAGFMDGSSCMSCHSRAGIKVWPQYQDRSLACGNPVLSGKYCYTIFGLGVFENNVSEFGYARSAHGIPNENWFYDSATPPDLNILQTDFIWGFLFAQPLVK